MFIQFISSVFICSKIDIDVIQFPDGLWILILKCFHTELQATSLSYNKAVIENSDVSETLVKVSGVFWFLLSWNECWELKIHENYIRLLKILEGRFFWRIFVYVLSELWPWVFDLFFQSLALLEKDVDIKLAVLNVLQHFSKGSGEYLMKCYWLWEVYNFFVCSFFKQWKEI